MPPLSFGLKTGKPPNGPAKPPNKRKAAFEDPLEHDADQNDNDEAFGGIQIRSTKTKAATKLPTVPADRPSKSPRLEGSTGSRAGTDTHESSKYMNLSSLRSAKLQDAEAAKLDASVYDYDEVYETFNVGKERTKASENGADGSTPKYMTSLLASAEVRKRDQLRAREKLLQKERENEGDEYADKEKFVTTAYKKQQEELLQIEEHEKKRAAEEEERRQKGGGMTAFHKDLLKKDEERQKAVEAAAEAAKLKKQGGNTAPLTDDMEMTEVSDSKIAAHLNEKGAHIIINDDGEIVDKRQLLTAGLNVVPKKLGAEMPAQKTGVERPQTWHRSSKIQDARMSQRERQSRMIEQQIEEISKQQEAVELQEEKEREERNKSKLTETDKLSARERFLQRKKEREDEARKSKAGSG